MDREPFSGSASAKRAEREAQERWGERRRAARVRAAVVERARAASDEHTSFRLEPPPRRGVESPRRRRRRLVGGAAGVAAMLALGVAALLASGFTLEPEREALAKSGLQAQATQLRSAERRRVARALAADEVLGVKRATLESIAECESGGRPDARSSDGTYLGKYQFDRGTWARMGGQGDPARAPELGQDLRAAELYKAAGSSPWPACG